ncbi:MAG: tellurite resistance TerB family protein [Geminicoccaceae bacterium]|nr:MAG: tellurite resistance TerB family protein [Geminicoccaceae bacterium]
MSKTSDLIGRLLDDVLSRQSGQRVDSALGPSGLNAPNVDLARILAPLEREAAASGGFAGLAGRLFGAARQSKATSAGTGALLGVLLGGNRKSALAGGALGLLGSLALTALAQSGRMSPPERNEELPPSLKPVTTDLDAADADSRADLLLNAMVQAAKADGHIDDAEMERIQAKLGDEGTDPQTLRRLMSLMRAPLDLDSLVVKVNDVETAAEVYIASVLTIEINTDEERAYLAELADRTGLDATTVAEIHRMVGIAPPPG